jgi:hypothetical protein
MSYKGSSHIGLYLSTHDLHKISEFYEAFWVLISDRLPIKIQEGGRILTCAHRRPRSTAAFSSAGHNDCTKRSF